MSRAGSCREVRPNVYRLRWDGPPDPRTGARRQLSCTVSGTPAQAARELLRRQQEAEKGAGASGRLSVADFLTEWLESASPALAPTSVRNYAAQVASLTRGLGAVPLTRLSGRHLQAHYAKELARGLDPASVVHQHTVLRIALRKAKRWKLISDVATDDADPPRVRRPEPTVFGAADLRALITAARGSRLYAPLMVLLCAGLRSGELLALWWEDLDAEAKTLEVRRNLRRGLEGLEYGPPKSAAGQRTFTLLELAWEALREHEREQEAARRGYAGWREHGLVFPREDGTPWHPESFASAYTRLRDREGLPPLTLHRLRHLNLSSLSAVGVSSRVIQARAGHSSIRQTSPYLHVLEGEDIEAARKLDRLLRENLGLLPNQDASL